MAHVRPWHFVGWAMVDLVVIIIGFATLVVTSIGVAVAWIAYNRGRRAERTRTFRVEDDEWVDERYDYERLLRELVGLDYASVPGLDQTSEGLPSQWAPLFEKSKGTWRVIINHDAMIVAYWSFFFPTDEVLDRLRKGRLFEGTLTVEDILHPTAPIERPILVSMLAIHPALGGDREIRSLLYASMVHAIDDLRLQGVFITDIYANAFTKKGKNIALRMGLQVQDTGEIGAPLLVGRWSDDLRSKLLRHAARSIAQI
jgi:cbb3-type cytochrome oxidase subunit 3